MKKIIFLFILGVFLTIPNMIKADEIYFECKPSELTKLQKLATNIVSSYDYNETFLPNSKYGSVNFTVKLSNLNDKLYIVDTQTKKRYNYMGNELVIPNMQDGKSLKFEVYANGYGCYDNYLLTIYVNLPSYNKYYVDDVCKDYQGYKLCNKWTKVDMSYEEFKKGVLEYAPKKEVEVEKEKPKTFEDIFAEIIDFLDRYKLQIFVPIILISAGWIVYLKLLKRKEYFDLK